MASSSGAMEERVRAAYRKREPTQEVALRRAHHSLAGRSFSNHGIRRQREAVPSDGFDFCAVCSGAACLFFCSAVL